VEIDSFPPTFADDKVWMRRKGMGKVPEGRVDFASCLLQKETLVIFGGNIDPKLKAYSNDVYCLSIRGLQ